MLGNIKNLLFQPYPDKDGVLEFFKNALIAGVIVFSFLFVFRPFGLFQLDTLVLLRTTLMFGVITFLVTFIFDLVGFYVLRIRRDHQHWVFYKWLLYTCILLICIAVANFIYICKTLLVDICQWTDFFNMLISTMLIGIFPILIFGTLHLIRQLKLNQSIAASVDDVTSDEYGHAYDNRFLSMSNGNEVLRLNSKNILFIEAMQNYVSICHLEQNTLTYTVIRKTIKALHQTLEGTSIVRSHRSFLVNKAYIVSTTGNAQGLKLHLKGLPDIVIPVSRKYIREFRYKATIL